MSHGSWVRPSCTDWKEARANHVDAWGKSFPGNGTSVQRPWGERTPLCLGSMDAGVAWWEEQDRG